MTQVAIQKEQLTQDQITTLVDAGIIPPNTPPAQVAVFARVCEERGLSPFSGEIHLTSYNTREGVKFSRVVGIGGYRKVAGRTQLHAGTDDAKFNLTSGGKHFTAAELKSQDKLPISATVTVYKIVGGMKVPFTHTCLFAEFAKRTRSGDLMQKWGTMPFQMIAKCAEAFALRKGFPEQLSGLSIPEEAAAFEDTNEGDILTTEEIENAQNVIVEIESQVKQKNTLSELKRYHSTNPLWADDEEIIGVFQKRQNEIIEAIKTKISSAQSLVALEKAWSENPDWANYEQPKFLFLNRKKELQ